jgi:hypothetical protein
MARNERESDFFKEKSRKLFISGSVKASGWLVPLPMITLKTKRYSANLAPR